MCVFRYYSTYCNLGIFSPLIVQKQYGRSAQRVPKIMVKQYAYFQLSHRHEKRPLHYKQQPFSDGPERYFFLEPSCPKAEHGGWPECYAHYRPDIILTGVVSLPVFIIIACVAPHANPTGIKKPPYYMSGGQALTEKGKEYDQIDHDHYRSNLIITCVASHDNCFWNDS